jgi:hypothetical protein
MRRSKCAYVNFGMVIWCCVYCIEDCYVLLTIALLLNNDILICRWRDLVIRPLHRSNRIRLYTGRNYTHNSLHYNCIPDWQSGDTMDLTICCGATAAYSRLEGSQLITWILYLNSVCVSSKTNWSVVFRLEVSVDAGKTSHHNHKTRQNTISNKDTFIYNIIYIYNYLCI